MLHREREQLEVDGCVLEIVRPFLELLLVIYVLDRDGNNFILSPDTLAIKELPWSVTSLCALHMHLHIKITLIINAFFLY